MNALIEALAGGEHRRWSRWMVYLFSKAPLNGIGQRIIWKKDVRHWQRQIDTDYANLSEKEKESDREQVRDMLSIIKDLGYRIVDQHGEEVQ